MLCKCGCGETTQLATRNRKDRGQVKGQPMLYLHGHSVHTIHGMSRRGNVSPEYSIYCAAKQRCTNPNDKEYFRYGGRGISFLFTSFAEFFAEVGRRPNRNLELDRINNDGNYAPGNIRWATKQQQDENKRKWGTCRKQYL